MRSGPGTTPPTGGREAPPSRRPVPQIEAQDGRAPGPEQESFIDQVLAASDPDTRRLAILKAIVARHGMLEPQWNADAEIGYSYFGELSAMDSRVVRLDLNYLSSGGYLKQQFKDRLTRCPHCSSHRLNVREVCPDCGSANISSEELLSHFRCGYVGPRSAFGGDDGNTSLICPKCMRALEHLGTDYDIPGMNGVCYNCHASFQEPPVEAACLSCGRPTPSEDLQFETVWSFHASGLGYSAARDGYLFDRAEDFLFEPGFAVLKAAVFMAMALQEIRRHRRYSRPLSFLLATLEGPEDSDLDRMTEDRTVEVLKADLREVDFIGRLDKRMFVIALPETDLPDAALAAQRLSGDVRAATGVAMAVQEIKGDTLMEMVRDLHSDSMMANARVPGMLGG